MLPLKSTVLEESMILVRTPTGNVKAKWVNGQLIPIEEVKPSTTSKQQQAIDAMKELLKDAKFEDHSINTLSNFLDGEIQSQQVNSPADTPEDKPKPDGSPPVPPKPISDQVFRQQLSSIMTDNKFDRIVKNRRRGKLDMTRLPKVQTGSQSVFTQKQARKNKEYNVVIVVDESGSMRDEGKREVAGEAIAFLAAHMDNLVDLAVVGFNSRLRVHKEFGVRVPGNLAMDIIHSTTGATNSYEALERAYKMLAGKPGNNMVLFMSDGSPGSSGHRCGECGGDYEHHDNLENIQKFVRSHTEITTIGFGIKYGAREIPDNVTINNLEELKPRLLEQLQRTIQRG